MSIIRILFILLLLFSLTTCKGQSDKNENNIREPQFAGKFYTADAQKLKQNLQQFFHNAEKKNSGITRAVIAPHAGYVFSGQVAASAFSQIDAERTIQNVFLLGSAHKVRVRAASVYDGAAYRTPLKKTAINREIVQALLKNEHFRFNQQAHEKEHSLEVELPFLQYHLQNDFKIIPVLINTRDDQQLKSIADVLSEYYTPENLFVVSTDFSHYPKDKDACLIDSLTAAAVATGDPDKLAAQIRKNREQNVAQLHTSMCGLSAVKVMLQLVEANNHKVEKIAYRNSSESRYGEKNRVVGYWAMRVTESSTQTTRQDNAEFSLTDDEKRELLKIARETIVYYLKNNKLPSLEPYNLTPSLKKETGCFVTLHKNKQLRGCIGNFTGKFPLAEGVQEMAVAAATEDHRFDRVKLSEMEDISIEISVLTPLKKINSLDEFELGRHGIYIKKGMHTGTYLPQVAEGRNWSKEEFVSHCSKYKARLGADGWKKANLYTYEALIFSEKNLHHE